MSPSALMYRQRLVIERATDGAFVDDHGQADQVWTAIDAAGVPGQIQPKTALEVAQLNEAGAVVSTYTAYMDPTEVQPADRIRLLVDDGRRYQIDGVRDAAGLGNHLEIDVHMVEV